MSYQVLARKWRPQDFAGVVGQEPIVTALRNGLTEGRIAQAYLFSGIRGVGKTSVARILAKALNCERGPAAEPCNECVTCREITQGSDLDVIEVDAATYSKVEQVRDLTESLKYGPTRDRYKVVVVDEIHRLSRAAFDALLKIVEEPPPNLAFIFATTEIDSVPATILSRCQEFRFRRVPSPALATYLARIAEAEEIEVSEAALRLIARAGDGSVRDAVALLDQMATFGSGAISDEEAASVLGGVDHALFRRLLGAILEGRSVDVSAVVREVEEQGWDPRHVYTEFLSYCRDGLHLALGVDEVDLPREEAENLAELAKKTGYENLLRALHQLLQSEQAVRHSGAGALALEIAWLRVAELPKLTAVEEILAGGGSPSNPGSKASAKSAAGREKGPQARSKRDEARSAPPKTPDRQTESSSTKKRSATEKDTSPPPGSERTEPATGASSKSAPQPPSSASANDPKKTSAASPPKRHDETDASAPEQHDEAVADPPEKIPEESADTSPAERHEATADKRTPKQPDESAAAPPSEPSDDAVSNSAEPHDEPAAASPAQPPEEPEPPAQSDRSPASEPAPAERPADTAEQVAEFLQQLSRVRQALAAHLQEANRLTFEEDRLLIYAPPDDPWLNRSRLSAKANRAALEGALEEVWGPEATWTLLEERPVQRRAEPDEEPGPDDELIGDPRVQAVLDIFGGQVESVVDEKATGER